MIPIAWAVVTVMAFFTLVPLLGLVIGGGKSYTESMLLGFILCCLGVVAFLIVGSGSWAISTLLEHYEVTLL